MLGAWIGFFVSWNIRGLIDFMCQEIRESNKR